MKNRLRQIIPIFTILFLSHFCQAQQAAVQHKIVIQLTTADTSAWSSTIGGIKNIQKVFKTDLQIEVVVHGKALDFLVKDKTFFANEIAGLTKEGIVFSACENSMRRHNIKKADLLTDAFTVPSGVVEVILKQEQGWSYLKASNN
ncbi:MAG: DsrE family protein [Bacteroidetes bacterium]|nr:DsrE family protein [Bacteroidota bacterium]